VKNTAYDDFKTNLGLYQQQQGFDREDAKMKQAREFQLEDRAYQEERTTKELEQKYAYTYGDLNSENPTLKNIAIEKAV